MNVLYEEDGEFKVGAVLAQAPASFQVESPHGRRTKIKAANVVMQFERPSGAELLVAAKAYADTLDTDFLWQCCTSGVEFDFLALARDYVGREPTPSEAAGVLLKLHGAPMYFYRRGRGRYHAAPQETLERALAGLEKKKQIQARVAEWVAALTRFECPAEIAALRDALLYAPDRNRPETRAFEDACKATGLLPARLFERCGILEDSHDYHFNRFLHEFFPRGAGFPEVELPPAPDDLPLAPVEAFSLDDAGTTEIDDAFSIEHQADGMLRIGVHISAPALTIAAGSPIDAIARERLSTAYMPGHKITMLPPAVIAQYSLEQGSTKPAVSLYLTVSPADWSLRGAHSRIERVKIAANLHHARYDALNESLPAERTLGLPHEEDLRVLWRLSLALEALRGKASVNTALPDYSFALEGERVIITTRKRGAPLDKLVAELMILANARWGELLAERDVAAIYRAQTTGKVRLSVHAEPHEGLGVSCYAWMTSPLRRYVDLVNQRQLLASLASRRAPLGRTSEGLLTAMRAFELTYARYDEHQRAMETYWSLRWLLQESVSELEGVVAREGVVRILRLPLVLRVPSLPDLLPGTRVRVALEAIDLLERSVVCTWRETLAETVPEGDEPSGA
ncbi:MAG: RNB domain-containing ribonuclease [Proteobacteria bacterium]|nr:RNB domain-containing ribonuclease [Pseudomonadota bacterium]